MIFKVLFIFSFQVCLKDQNGKPISNCNIISLCLGIYTSENPPKLIEINTSGINKITIKASFFSINNLTILLQRPKNLQRQHREGTSKRKNIFRKNTNKGSHIPFPKRLDIPRGLPQDKPCHWHKS